MSTYVREKVLRIPMERINLNYMKTKFAKLDKDHEDHFLYYLDSVFPELFDYSSKYMFTVSPTVKKYFDYVLDYEFDADGEYGKIRALYESEKVKYLPVFQQLDPDVNMDDVRLVEFCWYNCCEAPDYYDDANDPFYDEV